MRRFNWWRPHPIDPPEVDRELPQLDGVTRSAESIRFSIMSVEFWVSPGGQVREWLRLNARLASWLVFPALLVLPLLAFILWQIVKCVTMLVALAGKIILLPILVLMAVVVVLVVVNVFKAILR